MATEFPLILIEVNRNMSRKSHSPYSPASTYESEEFERFTVIFFIVGIPLNIVLSYILSAFLIYLSPVFSIDELPIPTSAISRLIKLKQFDGVSHYSYLGTLITGVIAFIPTTCILFYGYMYNVVFLRKHHQIDIRAFVGLLLGLSFVVFMIWLFFLFDFNVDHRPLGLGRMFMWPLFPSVGGFASFVASALSFIVPVAFYKAISQIQRGQ